MTRPQRKTAMLVLRGGRLIDGTGAGPAAGVTIVVRNGRIAAVGQGPAGEWPEDAEIIDFSGMTLLPGLIDCHDHLAMHGYDLARRWGDYHRKSAFPHIRERARDLEEHHAASLALALEAGVKIAAGTDAGGHGHPPNALEIACLVRAGMAPLQALRAATGWAAECLGRGHEIGTVETGKLADLVAVDGDPLTDVGILQDASRIALVLKGGAIAANRLAPAAAAPN
jgi:imidazolonepropionase-like amidohydrolase